MPDVAAPTTSPDGRFWWNGAAWQPFPVLRPRASPIRLSHWFIPVVLAALGALFWWRIEGDQGFLGSATSTSIGDLICSVGFYGMALGYCLGRGVAKLSGS